jgi:hypothetical protein
MAAMNQNTVPIRSKLLQPKLAHGSPAFACSPDPGYWFDTLHRTNYVAGEAVQFNSSVSAMPSNLSPHSSAIVAQGTADTLLLRYALRVAP